MVFALKFSVLCLLESSFEQNDCATPYEISNDAPGRRDAQFENRWVMQSFYHDDATR